jgi:hypothetical protein
MLYHFEDFIKILWHKFKITIKEFPDWYLKYGSNQYYQYKELGELMPDIITLLVPALKARKASKAAEEVSVLKNLTKTDATLAERPTSALPYTIQRRFRNGKWENYASYKRGTELIVLEKEFKVKFSDWYIDIKDIAKNLESGKRGIIYGYKKGANMGHVFNVVNEKGIIKFLDGQTGKRAKLVYDYYQFLPTN